MQSTRLQACILEHRFAVTAEIVPTLTATATKLLTEAALIGRQVDAINVTDFAAGRTAMSSFAAAAILAANGYEPVVQATCRDRNRIALAGDLLGAAAQGVQNVLALTGDDADKRDQPEANPVFDLTAASLLELASSLSTRGMLPSGRMVEPAPHFFLGAADTPRVPDRDWDSSSLRAKLSAGARFLQTQFCFDANVARAYVTRLREEGLSEGVGIIIGVGPIASARSARWMNANLHGVLVPDEIVARLEQSADPVAEGITICAELVAELKSIEGVAGVHLMAPGQGAAAIAEVLAVAGPLRDTRGPGR